jgi:hypothetical protein
VSELTLSNQCGGAMQLADLMDRCEDLGHAASSTFNPLTCLRARVVLSRVRHSDIVPCSSRV